MAMKRVAILALAGAAFAQMDTNSSSVPDSTALAAYNTNSGPAISVTNPLTTTTDAASGVPASYSTNSPHGSTTPGDNYSSESITAVVGSSVTASSPVAPIVTVTDTIGVSSQPKTNTTNTHVGSMGAGGRNTPKPSASASASATTTSKPVSDDGVVNGISISLFLVSLTLTALLQM
ncbi:hypothetical protein F5B21DRAFT_482310 [Xylaria acuta]|nr:hypothetical protein F5B21DRAFT_482310 [Xylaria acuta]